MNSRVLVSGTEARAIRGEAQVGIEPLGRTGFRAALCAVPVVLICALSVWAAGQQPGAKPKAAAPAKAELKAAVNPEEKAIRDSAQVFTEAFNRGDAKAVAALWTPDGSLVDESGLVLKGREAIEKAYAKFFEQNPGAQVQIEVTSIEFPSDSVAVEDGVSKGGAKEGGPASSSRYTVVHVRKDGKWLMASVREMPGDSPARQSPLADLQGLIGAWEAKAQNKVLHTRLHWTVNNKFIQRDYTVDQDGVTTASGVQMIGWDPQAGQIRSWSFDSTGGHGTGFWTPIPEGWSIRSVGTLADGTPTTSQDFLIRVPGENRVMGWRSVERRAGAIVLPDLPEVVLDRVPEKR